MAARKYWLFKSEPNCYSFDDLLAEPSGKGCWDGVRNYQARNFMRDQMSVGDGVLFYHSSCAVPAVVGIAEVAGDAYPDPTQFDPRSEYHDPASKKKNPRWWLVDIKPVRKLKEQVPLERLRATPDLEHMAVLRRGNRLSITPVTKREWGVVLRMGGIRG